MALVCVVLPTYERAHTLRASVESLLGQGDVDFEVLVVDDGSTDDTQAVLSALRHPRLRVLSIPHGGVAAARNTGIAASDSPFVAFHDSDDVACRVGWSPAEFLARMPTSTQDPERSRMLPPETIAAGEEP